MTDWNTKNWEKGTVTFFEALGIPQVKAKWPVIEPTFTQKAAQQPNQTSGNGSGSLNPIPPIAQGSLQAYANVLLGKYGWSGQYASFNFIELAEAGWQPTARNPTSGALGLAQALGHGNANTAGSLGNEYGGFGLTDDQARQANSGNGYWQLVWMCNYIKATYGDPNNAAAFHREHGWY